MAASRAEILARLGAIIAGRLRLADLEGKLTEETGLLGAGIGLDSVEILSVVCGIEEEFGLTIDDEELLSEYFLTAGSLVTFVERRLRS